jgi:hypothetical protein
MYRWQLADIRTTGIGAHGHDGSVMVVFGETRETLEQQFGSMIEVSRTTNRWGQPHEIGAVYICRNAKQNLQLTWPTLKRWI